MNISKKALGLAMSLLVATNISSANAQSTSEQEALLFKISDVNQIKNSDGDVVACDFKATFYNRSSYNIKDASVEFGWKDSSIDVVVAEEKKEDSATRRVAMSRAYSETERSTPLDVSVLVDVPGMKPQKQATVDVRVNTDRCFLLVEPVDFNVKTCNAEGLQEARRARTNTAASGCSRLFKFVSPEDPQYHLEFSAVSVDELKEKEEAKMQEGKEQVNTLYKATSDALEASSSIISGIK